MAAKLLVGDGHEVILHARNKERAQSAMNAVEGAKDVIVGDFSSIEEIKSVAEQANRLGSFDAVIHNAAIGYREPKRLNTVDGLAHLFTINSLAPYILTCLIEKPERLIYLSSGLHHQSSGRRCRFGRLKLEGKALDRLQGLCRL